MRLAVFAYIPSVEGNTCPPLPVQHRPQPRSTLLHRKDNFAYEYEGRDVPGRGAWYPRGTHHFRWAALPASVLDVFTQGLVKEDHARE